MIFRIFVGSGFVDSGSCIWVDEFGDGVRRCLLVEWG